MLEIYVIFFEPGLDNLGYAFDHCIAGNKIDMGPCECLTQCIHLIWQKVKIACVFMCKI